MFFSPDPDSYASTLFEVTNADSFSDPVLRVISTELDYETADRITFDIIATNTCSDDAVVDLSEVDTESILSVTVAVQVCEK